jgi:hypothetical protein
MTQGVTNTEMFYLVVFAGLIAWLVTVFVYVLLHRSAERMFNKLVGDFQERFPHQCFICSYYRHVMFRHPPEHDCRHWTGEDR